MTSPTANPADPSRCSRCGAPKPAAAPCPHCLLQLGLSLPPRDPEAAVPRGTRPIPSPAEIATHFPGLEITGTLGQGGMGVVYRARQRKLGREVALKILAPELGGDPAFGERFLREARAMARLDHPNIVMVYDFGETDGLCWLLMEFVDGVNLRQALAAGALTPEKALAIVPQLCDALQAAHDLGVVHRDIKPENVLLDRAGKVKIADFGLAKLAGELEPALTRESMAMGTLHYMAPEQLQGAHAVDHRADIFSLGVVFYEMLTGALPLGRFAPPSQRVQVDVRLDEIVLRTLEQEPSRRYQQAVEVKTDVQAMGALAPLASPAPEPVAPRPHGQRAPESRAHKWLVSALVAWMLLFPMLARFLSSWGWAGYALLGLQAVLWLYGVAHENLRREPELRAEHEALPPRTRFLRTAGFAALAGLALVVVGAALESFWTLGTDDYADPVPLAESRVEPWSEAKCYSVYALLPHVEVGETPELGAPQRDRWMVRHSSNPAATALLAAALLLGAGLCLVPHPRGRGAWLVLVTPLLGVAWGGLYAFVILQIEQSGQVETLTGLGGTLAFEGDIERVRKSLLSELAKDGYEARVEIGETLVTRRARTPVARHEVLGLEPRDFLARWQPGKKGPQRLFPGLVLELTGTLDGSHTVLTWDSGLWRASSAGMDTWRHHFEGLFERARPAQFLEPEKD